MDELFNQSMEGMLTGMSQEFCAFMPAEDVMASVERACDFFHIDEPRFVTEGLSTGVFTLDQTTMQDDILIYNPAQLESMGITGQDAVDLVMTHEGTHRMLQGMEMGFNSHQEELCCDYMAGVRAGLNGMDTSQLIDALDNSMESSTHPEGAFRVAAIQAGMEFAHQFEQQPAPTFSECLEEFKSGSMHDIVELEHLKDEMFSHECTMRHYQRALESDPNNESLQQHFYDSEARYHISKLDYEGKQAAIEHNRIEKELPENMRHGNAISCEGVDSHYNPAFGKASDAEISKLQSKVSDAQHNVDVKKQNVHNWTMNHNYNRDDVTTARHLNEAKNELAKAQQELENAKHKLNQAKY